MGSFDRAEAYRIPLGPLGPVDLCWDDWTLATSSSGIGTNVAEHSRENDRAKNVSSPGDQLPSPRPPSSVTLAIASPGQSAGNSEPSRLSWTGSKFKRTSTSVHCLPLHTTWRALDQLVVVLSTRLSQGVHKCIRSRLTKRGHISTHDL